MKVCMIAPHSVSMIGGGPRIQLLRTAEHLPKHGVEVSYFDGWREYGRNEFDLHHLFGASMITYDIARRLSEYGRPYVVSSIFYTMRSPAFIRLARRLGEFSKRFYQGIWTDYGLAAEVCRLAQGVLPNTTSEARIITEGFEVDRARVHLVPNGVDASFLNADPKLFIKTYGIRDFVLNVGHIGSTRKNVLGLVRALERIDVPAVIIGQVQRNDYSRRILDEAKRNPRITIIEGLPNDSPMLASAYAASALFVLPSLFETPGIAALEAGLAGTRGAITIHGGTTDYFGDMAEYCEPTLVTSIRSAIEQGLERPRDRRLREHIRAHYLWEEVARRTAEAYDASAHARHV